MKSKRISFHKSDAEHLYEWLVGCWGQGWENCFQCDILEKRLKQFIGTKEAKRIRRIVKENPYGKTNL